MLSGSFPFSTNLESSLTAFVSLLFQSGGALESRAAKSVLNVIGHLVQFLLFLAATAVKQQSLAAGFAFEATHTQAEQTNRLPLVRKSPRQQFRGRLPNFLCDIRWLWQGSRARDRVEIREANLEVDGLAS